MKARDDGNGSPYFDLKKVILSKLCDEGLRIGLFITTLIL